jgi:glutaredoxin
MDKKIIILVILLIIASYFVYNNYNKKNYDDFAKCLTNKEVKFFGTFWCSHCKEQKKLFGNSVQYLNYVECDSRGKNPNQELCQKEGINGYPTWIINNTKIEGVLSLEELADYSGCSLGG